MRKFINILSIHFIFIILAPSSYAQTQAQLKTNIQKLITQTDPQANIGIQVYSTKQKKIIFEQNADKLFTPASTLKLFTASAALHYLGPYYRFTTEVFKLNNHLYFKGSGDPSFNQGNIANLAAQIYSSGVRSVSGNLYVDDTLFDNIPYPSGWMWDDMQEGYSAPINALSTNWNHILITTKPAPQQNLKAQITLTPNTDYLAVKSSATTTKLNRAQAKKQIIIENIEHPQGVKKGDLIKISGKIQKNSKPAYHKFSVADPALFSGHLLKEELIRLGIKFSKNSKILKKPIPKQAYLIAENESQSLSEILIDLMKLSNNNGFESLLKTIGKHKFGKATWKNGLRALEIFVKNQLQISQKNIKLADGSGGSRYSLVSAKQFVKLLTYLRNNFQIGPDLLASLPISGRDGSLMYRFEEVVFLDKIRAKTGGMSGVTNLTGYLETKSGDILIFAILINGYTGNKARPYEGLQEQILRLFL